MVGPCASTTDASGWSSERLRRIADTLASLRRPVPSWRIARYHRHRGEITMRIAVFRVVVGAALLAAGYVGGRLDRIEPVAQAQGPSGRVFELRTYTTNEGK